MFKGLLPAFKVKSQLGEFGLMEEGRISPLDPCKVVVPKIIKAPSKLIDPGVTMLAAKDTAPAPF